MVLKQATAQSSQDGRSTEQLNRGLGNECFGASFGPPSCFLSCRLKAPDQKQYVCPPGALEQSASLRVPRQSSQPVISEAAAENQSKPIQSCRRRHASPNHAQWSQLQEVQARNQNTG